MAALNYPDPANVPTAVKNTALRYAYTYAVQEALRLRHNEEGQKFRDGEITGVEWQAFKTDWWEPRMQIVSQDLLELRAACAAFAAQFAGDIDLEGIV